eukprot:SAG11_NODE_452_length_9380_cov_10.655533_5_plen_179_part_00
MQAVSLAQATLRDLWSDMHGAVARMEVEGCEPVMEVWQQVKTSFAAEKICKTIDPDRAIDAFLSATVLGDCVKAAADQASRMQGQLHAERERRAATEAKLASATAAHSEGSARAKGHFDEQLRQKQSEIDSVLEKHRALETELSKKHLEDHKGESDMKIFQIKLGECNGSLFLAQWLS